MSLRGLYSSISTRIHSDPAAILWNTQYSPGTDRKLARKCSLYWPGHSKLTQFLVFQYHIDSFHWKGSERVLLFCLEVVFRYSASSLQYLRQSGGTDMMMFSRFKPKLENLELSNPCTALVGGGISSHGHRDAQSHANEEKLFHLIFLLRLTMYLYLFCAWNTSSIKIVTIFNHLGYVYLYIHSHTITKKFLYLAY